jgi:hypothetical protein
LAGHTFPGKSDPGSKNIFQNTPNVTAAPGPGRNPGEPIDVDGPVDQPMDRPITSLGTRVDATTTDPEKTNEPIVPLQTQDNATTTVPTTTDQPAGSSSRNSNDPASGMAIRPKFYKIPPGELYNPFASSFKQRFYPPANSPKEFDAYERLRMDIHLHVPIHYKTFVDLMIDDINGARNIESLCAAFQAHVDEASREGSTNHTAKTRQTQHVYQGDPNRLQQPAGSPGNNEGGAAEVSAPHASAASNSSTSPALNDAARKLILDKSAALARSTAASAPGGINGKAPMRVIVARTRNNDMVIKMEKRSGPGYTTHMETYMKNNDVYTKDTLKVDKWSYLVDPNDIFTQFGVPNSNGYSRRILVLVHTMHGPNQFVLNNAHNRALWANAVVKFYNDPQMQSEMRYAEQACFAGDVTPQDETNALPLSHWLNAQDTINYIIQVQANCNSFTDVLSNAQLMALYFDEAVIPRVQTQLDPNTQGLNRGVATSFNLNF